ncbi:MAG: hypothetical protein A7316_07280 [Candidatus Altiarchaeales archaeon WOR_SM1_86-2]|nr:MAG: hypothetical protein A7316_07280 [Candidatus Altiarchaeales archaeon WOR_SM1_86-2]
MMKVFVSHSVKDRNIVSTLKSNLDLAGIQTYIADEDYQPGTDIWEKVTRNIDDSDIVIAILTRDGDRSSYVNQEMGYASKANIQIIPIVEDNVKPVGALEGMEYIRFNRLSPLDAIDLTTQYLERHKTKSNDIVSLVITIIFFAFILRILSKK